MSTITRSANAASWSIVRSIPSATRLRSRSAASGGSSAPPKTSTRVVPVETKSPTASGSTSTQSWRSAHATRPRRSIAWIEPAEAVRTASVGSPSSRSAASSASVGEEVRCAVASAVRRPASATSAATFTGRSRWIERSRKTRNSTIAAPRRNPAVVTPMSGTESLIRRSSAYENISVPRSVASVAFRTASRYQIRMYRAENVPVAIWTTSTLTVTTNPVSAAVAATTVVSTDSAVPGE